MEILLVRAVKQSVAVWVMRMRSGCVMQESIFCSLNSGFTSVVLTSEHFPVLGRGWNFPEAMFYFYSSSSTAAMAIFRGGGVYGL